MIIWGSRGREVDEDSGEFFCPSCGSQQSYTRKALKRYFTLYFIPIFPMDTVQTWIQCSRCDGTFKEEVLQYDPRSSADAARQRFFVAIRATMIGVALRDSEPAAGAAPRFREAWAKVAGPELDVPLLERDLDPANKGVFTVERCVGTVRNELTTNACELLLRRGMAAASTLNDEQRGFLTEIGTAIGLSPAHIRGVLSEPAA